MTEQWRPVVGYEGLYEVSDQGRVRSLDRRVASLNRYGSCIRSIKGRIREPSYNPYGYAQVGIYRDGRELNAMVHQLVAEAFIGPRPEGTEVLHGQLGKLVNTPANLRYGTSSANKLDKRRDGTDHNVNKTHCPRGHLLESPNLVAWSARRGWRTCLACDRARADLKNAERGGRQVPDLTVRAHERYVAIMGQQSMETLGSPLPSPTTTPAGP